MQLDSLLNLHEHYAQLNDEQLTKALQQHLYELGCTSFIQACIPKFASLQEDNFIPTAITDYDLKWMQYYEENQLQEHDLALDSVLHDESPIYLWPSRKNIAPCSSKEWEVRQGAAEIGLNMGYSFRLESRIGLLNLGGIAVDCTNEQQLKLFFHEKHTYIERLFRLVSELRLSNSLNTSMTMISPLTAKETEVLHWLAHGLTYDQIAQKLTVGVSTIRKHSSSIIRKLNAVNTTHAVAIAINSGLIQ